MSIEAFDTQRRHLTGLAYRMLGSLSEAEDAVQDAYLRWHAADHGSIDNPRAYLSTIVTRLCLDRLKSARARREAYVGAWLPEPLLNDAIFAAETASDYAQDLTVGLMLALERLSPLERAAFLLHDVFDMDFTSIAEALDRDPAACRQLAARARGHIRTAKPRFSVSKDEGERLAQAFLEASRSGETSALQALLAKDVVFHADGGGKKPAAVDIILGDAATARFFTNLARKAGGLQPIWRRIMQINGLPGFITVERDGTLQTTALEIAEGRVTAIYVVRNPDKLEHLVAKADEAPLNLA